MDLGQARSYVISGFQKNFAKIMEEICPDDQVGMFPMVIVTDHREKILCAGDGLDRPLSARSGRPKSREIPVKDIWELATKLTDG